MAALTGNTIASTYKDLLQVSNSNSGVDGTLRNVEDGEGTASALQISSSAVNINGGLTASGDVNFDSNTLFVDASENEVMIGSTTSGRGKLSVVNTGYAVLALGTSSSSGSRGGAINFENETPATEGQILYDTDSDFMQFKTAGTTALTIDSSQRVGIGITSPSSYHSSTQLAVGNTSGEGQITIVSGSSNDANINFADGTSGTATAEGIIRYKHSNNQMELYTGQAVALTIDSSQRVGIGTTSPSDHLHIKETGGGDAVIKVDNNAYYMRIDQNSVGSTQLLTFKTGASLNDRMRIDSSGNVGIGETSPITKLDVRLDSSSTDLTADYAMFINNQTGAVSGRHATIGFGTYNNGGLTNVFGAVAEGVGAQSGFAFLTHNGGALTEKVRIANDGDVGIGTTSPTTKLHLSDGTNTAVIAKFTNDTTGNTINDGSSIGIDGDGDLLIYNVENKEIKFYTNDTQRAVIDNGGNLGIGETNPTTKLFVKDESATPVNIRRAASDGDVINFQRGATGVAAIQINSSSASFRNYSDRRLKKDFTSMNEVLEKINSINLYSYKLKIDESSSYGATAQELNDIFPELVKTTDDGTGTEIPENTEAWSISSDMNWILIKAIQELSEQNDLLTARIEALDAYIKPMGKLWQRHKPNTLNYVISRFCI